MKASRLLSAIIFCAAFSSAQQLPNLPRKPTPEFETRSFCPPEGLVTSNHNDPDLNKAKNRIDGARRYFSVDFAEIKNLDVPANIARKKRSEWRPEARESVAKTEGIPVQLVGFLALTTRSGKLFGAIAEGKELCNCQRKEPEFVDYHLWLVERVGDKKSKSIVVEITPRVRKNHKTSWTIQRLTDIAIKRLPVRVSGWLMLDQEHTEQIGVHRATLWELHPIIKFEFKERGRWNEL